MNFPTSNAGGFQVESPGRIPKRWRFGPVDFAAMDVDW